MLVNSSYKLLKIKGFYNQSLHDSKCLKTLNSVCFVENGYYAAV